MTRPNRVGRREVLAALQGDRAARTFAGRVRVARTVLGGALGPAKPLGAGSGRVVFDLGDGTVLKIAKNPKGVSQNQIESDGFIQQSYADVVAPVVDSDTDDLWLVMMKAKRVGPKRFEQLSGISSRKTGSVPVTSEADLFARAAGTRLSSHYLLLQALQMLWAREHGQQRWTTTTEEDAERILATPFAERLASLMRDMDMPPGDFGRLSTYGELDGRLVLVDYGLSSGVWEEHYKRNRSRYWGTASNGGLQ